MDTTPCYSLGYFICLVRTNRNFQVNNESYSICLVRTNGNFQVNNGYYTMLQSGLLHLSCENQRKFPGQLWIPCSMLESRLLQLTALENIFKFPGHWQISLHLPLSHIYTQLEISWCSVENYWTLHSCFPSSASPWLAPCCCCCCWPCRFLFNASLFSCAFTLRSSTIALRCWPVTRGPFCATDAVALNIFLGLWGLDVVAFRDLVSVGFFFGLLVMVCRGLDPDDASV